MLGAGPLMRDDSLPYMVNGVAFRTTDPTRREEYHWAADVVVRHADRWTDIYNPVVLDAGCGYDPTIHLFPYMIAPYASIVLAVDGNPEHLKMPAAPGIFRLVGDIAQPTGYEACVDVWTCISVLEHMAPTQQRDALDGAFKILKPGGLLVVTADVANPILLQALAIGAGFEVGPITEGESDLDPKVSYLVARKP